MYSSLCPRPLAIRLQANLIAYALNVLFTYGIGVAGLFNLPDNTVLSEKYQTLVTPIGWAFSIWGPIFISEAIFTIAQLLPKYRGNKIVQEGVGYWYAAVCIAQVSWTFSFSFEVMWLAFVLMFTILFCLANLLRSTYDMAPETVGQYWLLKFPFELHCGWIVAASAVNFSVLFVAYGDDDNMDTQLSVAIVSIAGVIAAALFCLFVLSKPIVTIGGVQAWALGGIAAQLSSPLEKTLVAFGETILSGVEGASAFAAIALAIVVALMIVKNVVLCSCHKKNTAELMEKFSVPLTGTESAV